MKIPIQVLPVVLVLFALLGAGCVSSEDNYVERADRRAPATLLTLFDESHQLTPGQLAERRQNIVTYLVTEGYIYSGEDLVQSAAAADQIIRADLATDGSFELTVYRPNRASHREVAFDPAGDPEYPYFPGDYGYFGDGINPYFVPLSIYFDERHNRDRPHHDRDSRHPARPIPPGQRRDWNRDHPWSRFHGADDDHDHRQGPPSAQQPGGKHNDGHDRDRRPDHDRPGQPNPNQPRSPHHEQKGNDHQQPKNPAEPVTVSPPPATVQPGRPETHRSGSDRQPWNSHPVPPSASKPIPQTAVPSTVQKPIEPHGSRPEPQLQRQPANTSRSIPASPPSQGRSRSDGVTPRPVQTPAPARSAPEPVKDQSAKSDSNQNGTNPNDHRR